MRVFGWRLLASILLCLGLWGASALAQVRIDIPGGRGRPDEGPSVGQIVGGLLALKDGYDRSRRGFICVQTYNDANANGARDNGEGPLPSWSFTIVSAAGAPAAQGQTDARGRFCNERRLAPGVYRVAQASGAGWVNTEPGAPSPNTKSVALPADKSVIVLFGNCAGDRCGRVSAPPPRPGPGRGPPPPTPQTGTELRFHKVVLSNAPGGGYPLTGLTFGTMFEIFHSCVLGGQSYTNVTDVLPNATFPIPGHVNIPVNAVCTFTETPPQGSLAWTPCPSGAGQWAPPVISPQPLIMAPGVNVVTVTNRFVCSAPPPTASICVTKYHDLNGNGLRDPGEPLLPGWIFSVKTGAGAMVAFGTTNAQGKFCTPSALAVGGYSIFETPKPGWTSTNPGGALPTKAITLVAGQAANVDFGNRTPGVCVTKYNDLNGNGARNTGEPALPGWAFAVKNASGVVIDSGVTGAQGLWCTTQPLPVGAVTVAETPQPGWFNTDPGGSTPTKALSLVAGQTANVKFGNRMPPSTGKICVVKYRSMGNSSGGFGAPLLAGWQFTVTGPSGPLTVTTGANGKACTPATLAAGTYTVVETMQAGWTSVTPGGATPQRTAVVMSNTVNLDFGNALAQARQICVNKYHDLDKNGRWDAGEPTLPGWTFEVRNGAGVLVATATTDAQGRWCSAANLPTGAYTVTEVVKPWWVTTDPAGPPNASPPYDKTASVSPTLGADLHFGNMRAGQACVTKYNDLNGNGQRDPGEPPLAGFTFRFQGTSSATIWDVTLTTDASGMVCVYLPPSNQHMVLETAVPGWVNTDPGTPGTFKYEIFTIVEGQTNNLLFGNRQSTPTYGRICVVKFNDLNGDGVKQAGEPLLGGWQFSIVRPNGTQSGITAAGTGQWCTPQNYPPGSYTVTETLQPGWVSTTPGGTPPQTLAAVTGGQTTMVAFGNRLAPPTPGGICVVKFNDLNGDGVKQTGEPVLGGWQFSLAGPSGPLSGTTDDRKGQWCAPKTLTPGTYTISETMKPGWVSTTPGGTAPQVTVVVASGQAALVAFGNRKTTPPTGQVCVTKYNDLNVSGQRGVGEPSMAGWQMSIRNGAGATIAQGTTDSSGQVCFTLPPGAYQAFEVQQPGWSSSDPGGANPPHKPVTVVNGQSINVVFGNYQPTKLRFRKVVLSNAPSGGFPLTGLTFGNAFTVNHNCVLGNQTGGGATYVPANGIAPMAGYTGSSVNAVCTTTETPPPGIIAYAPCPTGGGHWATPIISPSPLTLAPGMNEVTVTNQFVCEKAAVPSLSAEKFVDLDCGPVTGITNPCVFRIRIKNVGTAAYSGPVTFTDSVNFQGLPQFPGATVLVAPLPSGWGCIGTSAPITCTGNVSLGAGQWIDVVLTMNLAHAVMPSANCARLIAPVAAGPSCVPIDG